MSITTKSGNPLTIREKIALRLIMFAIQIVEPYEFEHQFKEHQSELKSLINSK